MTTLYPPWPWFDHLSLVGAHSFICSRGYFHHNRHLQVDANDLSTMSMVVDISSGPLYTDFEEVRT